METVTVYLSKKSDAFRVVTGEHAQHADAGSYTVHVYQGRTLEQCAKLALKEETREDVKAQITRFLPAEVKYETAIVHAQPLNNPVVGTVWGVEVKRDGALVAFVWNSWDQRMYGKERDRALRQTRREVDNSFKGCGLASSVACTRLRAIVIDGVAPYHVCEA